MVNCWSSVPPSTPSRSRHPLIFGGRSILGRTGTPVQNEDSLAFSSANGVAAMIETLPFEDAPKAYERMMSGQARFRVVLDVAGK
jgi:propanol-preferring alcohol dehydrogenase